MMIWCMCLLLLHLSFFSGYVRTNVYSNPMTLSIFLENL
jgi:hypothetical protein